MNVLPDGIYAATLTPFDADLLVDHGALVRHVRQLLEYGCDGVVCMGTTGEANSLSTTERMAALDALVEAGVPPGRLMVGTGCCAYPDTLTLTRHAVASGVGGVLMLPPFYYKNVPDDGVFATFDRVIQTIGADGLNVYLYHFPQMSAVPFTRNLTARLVEAYPGVVVGMKDSSGDFDHMTAIVEAFPGFRVFAGTERYLSAIVAAGGAGCITATTNVTCPLAAMVYANPVAPLQRRLSAIRAAIEKYPMIPALKFLMAEHTGQAAWRYVRPPHVGLPVDGERELLSSVLPNLRTMWDV